VEKRISIARFHAELMGESVFRKLFKKKSKIAHFGKKKEEDIVFSGASLPHSALTYWGLKQEP